MAKSKLTVREFFDRFPTEEACLEHVMKVRYGLRRVCDKCKIEATFHRLGKRPAYSCAVCGAHVYPCAGTVLQDTRTPLQMWFYAIYLFVVTRHGVSGKELERQLGVTYKTAWRMGQQIRKHICTLQDFSPLQGHIEIDEAYVGGVRRGGKRGRGAPGKTVVIGLKERGGRMVAETALDSTTPSLRAKVEQHVEPGSKISTDEYVAYSLLNREGFDHRTVKHKYGEYARRDRMTGELISVNAVENFWKLFKDSVRSTHIHVSGKYMDRYLGEFTFRANRREMGNAMFDLLVAAF
ncbi:MAG: IS1595 family transposase [Terricaulis sp.]